MKKEILALIFLNINIIVIATTGIIILEQPFSLIPIVLCSLLCGFLTGTYYGMGKVDKT